MKLSFLWTIQRNGTKEDAFSTFIKFCVFNLCLQGIAMYFAYFFYTTILGTSWVVQ